MKVLPLLGVLSVSILLAGCQATGEEYKSDVYDSSTVNTQQEMKTVKIIAITNAKVKVDNTKGRQDAMVAGAVVGGILGGVVGYNTGYHGYYDYGYYNNGYYNTGIGSATGAVVGAAAGSMVDDHVLVPGVTLAYVMKGRTYSSTQVGKRCLFKLGKALMVTTTSNETRIQPNSECPPETSN